MYRLRLGVRCPLLLIALVLSAVAGAQDAKPPTRHRTITGDVRMVKQFHSEILKNDRDIAIYLPPGYERDKRRRYPVLYMADGQNLFNLETSFLPDQEWRADESAESLIEAGLIEPVIIVGINNAGMARGDEYLPTHSGNYGGKADLYGRMLVEEIKPMIDRTYRTRTGSRDTGLGGSSFGGVITMVLGAKYPNVFGKLAILSPSVWWDNQVLLKIVDQIPVKTSQRIWIDIGTSEGGNAQQKQDSVAGASALKDHLAAKGWRMGRDLAFFRDYDAAHNERAWAHRFPSILMFLFPSR